MDRNKVAELITIHEGKKNVAYRDTRNKLTVGIGFNLMRPGAYSIIEGLNLNYDDVCSGKCKLMKLTSISCSKSIYPTQLKIP
jgi:GH24 family phage-related lysozyme (muramidase)